MSAWKDFVTASLLGTSQGGATPALPASLEGTLGPAAALASPEAQFLTRAGALALWRRVGRKLDRTEASLPTPAPPETWPLMNPASIGYLRVMLGGRDTSMVPEWLNHAVFPEWLREAARRQRRLPPELLPALLEGVRVRGLPELRAAALAVGGARARWLAVQSPAWNFAVSPSSAQWETGTREQRVTLLRAWRVTEPAQAREKLAAAWTTEPADARHAFLAVVAETLSGEDAPFLDAALDDRSKEIRLSSADLLARLPGSAFVARMLARAEGLLAFKRGGLLGRAALQVTLPGEPDAAARRDGLDPKTLLLSPGVGERAALLSRILAAAPLDHWTGRFEQTPETLLAAADRSDFAEAVGSGWAQAAINQRHTEWAAALLEGLRLRPHARLVRDDQMFEILPAPEREKRLLAAMRAEPLKVNATAVEGWIHLLGLFGHSQTSLPDALTRLALAQLRRAAFEEPQGLRPHRLRNLAATLALRTSPALLPEALEGWPGDKDGVPALLNSFAFRRDALASLTQP